MTPREVAAFLHDHTGPLSGRDWLEIRCLASPVERGHGSDEGPRDWFQNPTHAAHFALLHCDRWEVYFGVNPRVYRGGKKADVTRIDYLHGDIDAYGEGGGYPSKSAAMDALFAFIPHVTRAVDSGGGLHAYWKLVESLPPTPENILRVESTMRAIYRALGTKDRGVQNIDRILRVPGTINHKYGERVKVVYG